MGKPRKKSAAVEAKELEMLERGARVVELRKAGASFRTIAQKLRDEGAAEVTYATVRRDFKDAIKVARDHHAEMINEYFHLQIERAESLMLAHWILAIGKAEMVKNEDTGQMERRTVKPSVSSAYLVMTIWKALNELLYGSHVYHEHTGKDGKPIEYETKVYAGFDLDKV